MDVMTDFFAASFLDDLQIFEDALGGELHGFTTFSNSGKVIIRLLLRAGSLFDLDWLRGTRVARGCSCIFAFKGFRILYL